MTTLSPTAPDARDLSPTLESLLRERAERLAHRPAIQTAQVDVLACLVAGERCAVTLTELRAVNSASGVTPIPCVPATIAGLLNVRGQIVTVVDLSVALGLRREAPADRPQVVLVDRPDGRREQVGLLVDDVLGVEPLALDALTPALDDAPFIRGAVATPTATTILLDLDALLTGGRLDVTHDTHERSAR